MTQTITTNQVGNQILPPDDPDYISPEEQGADEQELAARDAQQAEAAEAERAKLAEEKETQHQRRDPPKENLEGEARRLRDQRDRLRTEKDEADRERQQLREELARYKARQELEAEAQERAQKIQREAERPDPEIDPYGAQLWDMQQELQSQRKFREQAEAQQRQQQEFQAQQAQQQGVLMEIQNYVVDDVTRYKQEHPDFDYDAAAKHVETAYNKFWQSTGLTPQEAQAVTANTFLAVGRSAQLRGQSAAGAVAQLAELTGFQRAAADNGAPKPPAAPIQQQQETQQDKIARIARGQKLQGLGGKTPSERTTGENIGLLTAQQMAEMSDDDYLRMKQDPAAARLLEKRLEELG